MYRADEVMQYLEQAHRFVFGAGFMAWEIRIGARNMLIAAPAAGILALCKSAGAGPDCYIPAVELFYAALSAGASGVALFHRPPHSRRNGGTRRACSGMHMV